MSDRIAKEGSLSAVPEGAQADYWNSAIRVPWVLLQERLDELFAPLSRAAMDQAQPLVGEHVLRPS